MILFLALAPSLNRVLAGSNNDFTIRTLSNNPGVLPIQLGNAQIATHYHDFLHFVDIEPIRKETETLQINCDRLHVLSKNLTHSHQLLIKNPLALLRYQLDLLRNKLNSLHLARSKRGLINGLGTVIKYITGNLDAKDGERYEKHIAQIERNQFKISNAINKQLSISYNIINRYNRTINIINNNMETLHKAINDTEQNLKGFGDAFIIAEGIKYATAVSSMLLSFVSELDIDLTFARNGILNPSLLTIDELKSIHDHLAEIYQPNMMLHVSANEFHKYISVTKTKVLLIGTKFTFILQVPIMDPAVYVYYHLYPAPNKNHTIILPPSPYLLWSQESYYFTAAECRKVNDYFCATAEKIQERCITNLLSAGLPKDCHAFQINEDYQIFTPVTPNQLLLIVAKPTKVRIQCRYEEIVLIQETSLINLLQPCEISIDGFKFYDNFTTLQEVKIMQLPPMTNLHFTRRNFTLEAEHLQKIPALRTELQTAPLILTEEDDFNYHTVAWPTLFASFLILGAVLLCIYRRRHNRQATTGEPHQQRLENAPAETTRRTQTPLFEFSTLQAPI